MVNAIKKEGKEYYQCGDCGFVYQEKELAQRCEDWCVAHKSCNMEITSHSVGFEPPQKIVTQ